MSSTGNCLFVTVALLIAFTTGINATQTMDAKIRDDSDLSQVKMFNISFSSLSFSVFLSRKSCVDFKLNTSLCAW